MAQRKRSKRHVALPSRNEDLIWELRLKNTFAPWRYKGFYGAYRANAAREERYYDKREAGWAVVERFAAVGHTARYTPWSYLPRGLGFWCPTLRRARLLRGSFNRHNDDPTYHLWGEAVGVLQQIEARQAKKAGIEEDSILKQRRIKKGARRTTGRHTQHNREYLRELETQRWRCETNYSAVRPAHAEQLDQAKKLIDRFFKLGYTALWGRGDANKGHGYWIYHGFPQLRPHTTKPGRLLRRKGLLHGNFNGRNKDPYFQTHGEALQLAARLEWQIPTLTNAQGSPSGDQRDVGAMLEPERF